MKKLIILALALTLFLSLAACSSKGESGNGGGNNGGSTVSSSGTVTGDGVSLGVDDETFYFDWETIEMFGGKEAFMDWLMYELELDAEDFYASVYGEHNNSPVDKISEERGWLDGYKTGEAVNHE